ncbi:hypothetical protein BPODLACK_03284 [Gordonia sp. YY1]|nr:hypothetical protein BPODLACK_03284 [Gordonia sp. YY1]
MKLTTVTPSRSNTSTTSSGARVVAWSSTTRRPPARSAAQISPTDTSKAYEWNIDHTSSGVLSTSASSATSREITLSWVTTTPFGTPVDPEVYMT